MDENRLVEEARMTAEAAAADQVTPSLAYPNLTLGYPNLTLTLILILTFITENDPNLNSNPNF